MEAQGLKVNTLEIAGMASVLQALRLPFGKECRSSCTFKGDVNDTDFTSILLHTESQCFINDKDLKLLSTLVKRGEEHSKCIRGLIVYAEIEAPRFWWAEADTYRIGTERLASESTIHIQGKGLSSEELVKMKSELTEGTIQKRVQMFSYQTLRRIWIQRHNHRLPMWHTFCEWIESLPFADSLILIGLKDGQD
jgi:hypothetical protein